jgi:hypothetical protein
LDFGRGGRTENIFAVKVHATVVFVARPSTSSYAPLSGRNVKLSL